MRLTPFVLATLALLGCKREPSPAGRPPADLPATPSTGGGGGELPPGHPPTNGTAPPTGQEEAPPAGTAPVIAGKLLERIESGGYSYLRIQADVWAAVNQTDVAVGTEVGVTDAMLQEHFESKTLNRTWDKIYFGTLAASPTGAAISGKLVERIESGGYSYLHLQGAETWAAVPETTVAVGSDVTVASSMLQENFESKTLNRKWDKIYFGTLEEPGAAGAGSAAAAGANPHGGVSTPATDVGPISVAKAEGADGHTVAEVFAQKAALADKTVSVRGKVVKYNGGVMGKNWLHVRDGSGSDASKDNDLTVTSADEAAVGDTVVIQGPVHLNRDFGAGYAYDVIVEDAKVTK